MKIRTISLIGISLLALGSCPSPAPQVITAAGALTVDMNFPTVEKARGVYIWIEDANGDYVDTVQQYGGENGSYVSANTRYNNDICDNWKTAVDEVSGASLVPDGVTGASILPGGSGSYTSETWDLRDINGNGVSSGNYTVNVEVTYDATDHPVVNKSTASGSISLGSSSGSSVLTVSDADGRMDSASVSFIP